MCLHIFAPGKRLQIDYAAESITLAKGGSEAVIDLLVTNHSDTPIERLHIVCPHPVPAGVTSPPDEPRFGDITSTWVDKDLPYNRFYQTDETDLIIEALPGGSVNVTVQIPNPAKITEMLSYVGSLRGRHTLVPYEVANGETLTDLQWSLLTELGWSVFSLKFEAPISPNEPRWLRLQRVSGVLHRNRRPAVEHWARKLCGILTHTFEIAGPEDMRHRLVSALEASSVRQGSGPGYEAVVHELFGLHDKLLTRGLQAEGTDTIVKDWRLNVFWKYRRLDEPTSTGDIVPSGGGLNQIRNRLGHVETCYQWKAGQNAHPQTHGGRFTVRLWAHDIPLFVIVLPWVSFFLALSALLSRPDVTSFWSRLWR